VCMRVSPLHAAALSLSLARARACKRAAQRQRARSPRLEDKVLEHVSHISFVPRQREMDKMGVFIA